MSDTIENAYKRVSAAKQELKEAEDVLDRSLAYPTGRKRDVFEVQETNDSLIVNSDADEIFVTLADGCKLSIHGHTGIIHITAGDNSVMTFEAQVGGANVNQGREGSVTLLEHIDTITIDQGEGSEVLTIS